MTVYNLTFIEFYEGEFGDLEGPITTQVGIFTTLELAEEAKSKTTFVEKHFQAQYGGSDNRFIIVDIELDTLVVSEHRLK